MVSDCQMADTGNKTLHIGSFTRSKILSKSLSCGSSVYAYRGLIKVFGKAKGVYNHTECDSLLIGNNSISSTYPYVISDNYSSFINQEASVSKLEDDFLFFLSQRGINFKTSLSLLIYGFCSGITVKLPLELELNIPLYVILKN